MNYIVHYTRVFIMNTTINKQILEEHDISSNNTTNNEVCPIESNIPQQTISEEANASSVNTNYTQDNFNIQEIDTTPVTLSVPYDYTNVLSTNSPELELVNYYFESISCRR